MKIFVVVVLVLFSPHLVCAANTTRGTDQTRTARDNMRAAHDYFQYKIRDLEDRVDVMERRIERLNKRIQQLSDGKKGSAVQSKTVEEYDADNMEVQIKYADGSEKPVVSNNVEFRVEEAPKTSNLDLKAAEREFYDDAFSALRENRVERAEKLFLEFIRKFPGSGLLGNAHYWLGEIYYSQQRYKEASSHFLSSYQLRPTGSKAEDSVLKMALSLEKLGNNSGACSTLMKLLNEFPNMHSETKRQVNIEISKLRCDNNQG